MRNTIKDLALIFQYLVHCARLYIKHMGMGQAFQIPVNIKHTCPKCGPAGNLAHMADYAGAACLLCKQVYTYSELYKCAN